MADQEEAFVDLASLAGGAALELFSRELERILENIADPNTDAEAVRELKLIIKLKPSESRESATVAVQAESKLAAFRGAGTTIFIGKRKGRMVALESNARQMQLKWDEESRPTPIRKEDETHE